MMSLDVSDRGRVNQQAQGITETFQIIVLEELHLQIIFLGHFADLAQIRRDHRARPCRGLIQHTRRTCRCGIRQNDDLSPLEQVLDLVFRDLSQPLNAMCRTETLPEILRVLGKARMGCACKGCRRGGW